VLIVSIGKGNVFSLMIWLFIRFPIACNRPRQSLNDSFALQRHKSTTKTFYVIRQSNVRWLLLAIGLIKFWFNGSSVFIYNETITMLTLYRTNLKVKFKRIEPICITQIKTHKSIFLMVFCSISHKPLTYKHFEVEQHRLIIRECELCKL